MRILSAEGNPTTSRDPDFQPVGTTKYELHKALVGVRCCIKRVEVVAICESREDARQWMLDREAEAEAEVEVEVEAEGRGDGAEQIGSPISREERDARARVVALLLGDGWTGEQVSAALKVSDAGGSVADSFAAMREAGESGP